MKYFFFSLLLVVILLSSCKKTDINSQKDQSSKFVKTWHDTVRIIPISEKLEIRQNKTFKYSVGACTSHSWSEGTWILKNDTIILNSFKPKECIYLSEYGAFCRTLKEMRAYESEPSITGCEPNAEEDYAMFTNERFYIKDDTLIHVKQNKKCEGYEFAYSPLEKIH